MPARRSPLERLLAVLAKSQGEPASSPPRDPWHAILWDNVVYLADDARRARALALLRRATGLDAARLADAPDEILQPICALGRMPANSIAKLRACAACFAEVGDPRQLVRLPEAQARKALRRFPGVGDPGADRLLLFTGAQPVLALESNGLRALVRLGYGKEAKGYGATYRSAVRAAAPELPADCDVRIAVYQTLRRHGQDICRRAPACGACPVAGQCPSAMPGANA